ncbi:MAG: RNA-binding protein [Alphaproteobacteria bacterium]
MTADHPDADPDASPDVPPDTGPAAKGSERRCSVSGVSAPKARLIRFVADPDGAIVPDLSETLPGRGCWVGASRDAVEQAIKRKAFARSLKRPVTAPSGLADLVERLLAERFLARLGLARRSGRLVTGFESVCETLRRGRAALLVEAADGAADGRTKVTRLAAKAMPGLTVCALARSDELGAALGQSAVVHAAMVGEALRPGDGRDMERFAGFRPVWPWEETPDSALRRPVPWDPAQPGAEGPVLSHGALSGPA